MSAIGVSWWWGGDLCCSHWTELLRKGFRVAANLGFLDTATPPPNCVSNASNSVAPHATSLYTCCSSSSREVHFGADRDEKGKCLAGSATHEFYFHGMSGFQQGRTQMGTAFCVDYFSKNLRTLLRLANLFGPPRSPSLSFQSVICTVNT